MRAYQDVVTSLADELAKQVFNIDSKSVNFFLKSVAIDTKQLGRLYLVSSVLL